MARKSRKRRRKPRPKPVPAEASAAPDPPARSREPRRRRPEPEGAPPAPWGSFPLVELAVLVGIVILVIGFLSEGSRQGILIGTGLVLCSVAGLELAIREHFAGYRSHTTLLSGFAAFAVISVMVLAAGFYVWILLAVGVVVFVTCFYSLRRVFQQRSGGLSFR
jgi:hypothetical protein